MSPDLLRHELAHALSALVDPRCESATIMLESDGSATTKSTWAKDPDELTVIKTYVVGLLLDGNGTLDLANDRLIASLMPKEQVTEALEWGRTVVVPLIDAIPEATLGKMIHTIKRDGAIQLRRNALLAH